MELQLEECSIASYGGSKGGIPFPKKTSKWAYVSIREGKAFESRSNKHSWKLSLYLSAGGVQDPWEVYASIQQCIWLHAQCREPLRATLCRPNLKDHPLFSEFDYSRKTIGQTNIYKRKRKCWTRIRRTTQKILGFHRLFFFSLLSDTTDDERSTRVCPAMMKGGSFWVVRWDHNKMKQLNQEVNRAWRAGLSLFF